jgi:hypothetical protein
MSYHNEKPRIAFCNPGLNCNAIEAPIASRRYIALRFSAADLPVLRSTTTSKETR